MTVGTGSVVEALRAVMADPELACRVVDASGSAMAIVWSPLPAPWACGRCGNLYAYAPPVDGERLPSGMATGPGGAWVPDCMCPAPAVPSGSLRLLDYTPSGGGDSFGVKGLPDSGLDGDGVFLSEAAERSLPVAWEDWATAPWEWFPKASLVQEARRLRAGGTDRAVREEVALLAPPPAPEPPQNAPEAPTEPRSLTVRLNGQGQQLAEFARLLEAKQFTVTDLQGNPVDPAEVFPGMAPEEPAAAEAPAPPQYGAGTRRSRRQRGQNGGLQA